MTQILDRYLINWHFPLYLKLTTNIFFLKYAFDAFLKKGRLGHHRVRAHAPQGLEVKNIHLFFCVLIQGVLMVGNQIK